jgi:urate oxidase
MGIVLGENRYGKAGVRLVRVTRRGERHDLCDLTVAIALSGDFEAVHLRGDNAAVLPTDSQKNAVYALAAEGPLGEIEAFALRLGRHFVSTAAAARQAVVHVEEHRWERVAVDGGEHPHAFQSAGGERRVAVATVRDGEAAVVAGLDDLLLLKTTGSEFHGFATDRYTTLAETRDRVLATAVAARWRHRGLDAAWAESFAGARRALLETFARHHSLSLQQTLYEMGRAALEARPELAEVRLSLPNRHHVAVDVVPFGLADHREVYVATDRPYGLIEGTVRRDDGGEVPGWVAW